MHSPLELRAALHSAAHIEQLRRDLPHCQIDVLCEPAVAAVFESHPHVSQVHCVNFEPNVASRSRFNQLANKIRKLDLYLKVSQRLRQEHYDRIYWKPNHAQAQSALKKLLRQVFVWASAINNAKYVAAASIQDESHVESQAPQLMPRMDLNYARRKFDLSSFVPTVIFVLGSATPKRTQDTKSANPVWANRHWVEFAYALQERLGKCQIVLLGSTAERHRATEVSALIGPLAFNLCGQTKLHEVMGLIAASHAVVGIDHPYLALANSLRAVTINHTQHEPRLTPNDTANAIEIAYAKLYAKTNR